MNSQLFVPEILNLCQMVIFRHSPLPIISRNMLNFINFCSQTKAYQDCQLAKVIAYFSSLRVFFSDSLKDITIALGSQRTKQYFPIIQKVIKNKINNAVQFLLQNITSVQSSSQRINDLIILCPTCFENVKQIMKFFEINLKRFIYINFCFSLNYKASTPTSIKVLQFQSLMAYQLSFINQYLVDKKCAYFHKFRQNPGYEETMRRLMLKNLIIIRNNLIKGQPNQLWQIILADQKKKKDQIILSLRQIINENYQYYSQKWKNPFIINLNKKRKQQHETYEFLDKIEKNWVPINQIFNQTSKAYFSHSQKLIIMKTRNENN